MTTPRPPPLSDAGRVVAWDRDVCVAYAADRQALYALQGKAALVRCWAVQ